MRILKGGKLYRSRKVNMLETGLKSRINVLGYHNHNISSHRLEQEYYLIISIGKVVNVFSSSPS